MKINFLLIFAISIVACNSLKKIEEVALKPFEGSLKEQLQNKDDLEDHYVNLSMLEVAEWLNANLNKDLEKELISAIIKSEKNTIALHDFLKQGNFSAKAALKFDLQSYEDKLKHKGVKYYFELFSPNAKDFLKVSTIRPLIGIGEAINEDDEIVGLKGDRQFYVSESQAKIHPTLIVTIGTDEIVYASESENTWSDNSESSRSSTKMTAVWDDYKIKKGYRYERVGKSDIRFDFTPYENWNCPGYPSYNTGAFQTYEFYHKPSYKIKSIKKSDVNRSQVFLDDVKIVSLPKGQGFRSDDHFFYITVYEYDWYASSKTVQGCSSAQNCNSYNYHYVQMKYNYEWYYKDYCGFGFKNSNVGDSFTVDNAKCTLTIKRTE